MGLVKRRASTKAKVSIEDFEEFLLDMKAVIIMEDILLDLIINWDQTGMHYVPISSWTMAKEGAKRMEICGIEDKKRIIAVFGCCMTGDFLPMQPVYQGKTSNCHPSFTDWRITHYPSHWSNEAAIKKIFLFHMFQKRENNYTYILITPRWSYVYDKFKGQCTPAVLELLEENNIDVFIPANCTDHLEPLDISVDKAAKSFMCDQFQGWYANRLAANA